MEKLKNKKGVAMENSILFILVIFSLCSLITTLAIIGRNQTKIEKNITLSYVELEQVGEDFLASLKPSEQPFVNSNENYDCTVVDKENGIKALTVKLKGTDTIVLYVEAAMIDEKLAVHRWNKTP